MPAGGVLVFGREHAHYELLCVAGDPEVASSLEFSRVLVLFHCEHSDPRVKFFGEGAFAYHLLYYGPVFLLYRRGRSFK